MKRPAIFFDRDNTLIVSDGYLGDPSQVVLVDGAADAIATARELGYAVVTFSNQSGVARGWITEDDVRAVNARIDELLRQSNVKAVVDRHEYCPFHPQAVLEEYRRDSDLRKPRPGMIHRAEQEMELDLSRSWIIGDAPRDIAAGHAAGCRTILFHDPTLAPSPAAAEEPTVEPEFIASSLKGALDYIEKTAEPLHQKVRAQPVRPDEPPSEPTPAGRALPHATAPLPDTARLERLTEQILHELRRPRHEPVTDFSVPRLLAGMVQVVALAVLFVSYLYRNSPSLTPMLLLALVLQTLTIALLIMGRMR